MVEFRFTVLGQAKTSGSKRSFRHKHTGKQVTIPADETQVNWQNRVAERANEEWGGQPLLTGPLVVEMVFYRPRLSGHFGTGRNAGVLKDSAPAYPAVRPDLLKLARAVEDSMSGIVYRDDGQIVQEWLAKDWGEPERVEVVVRPLEATHLERSGTIPLAAGV